MENIDKKAVVKEVLEWVYCIVIAVALALFVRYFIGAPTIVQQTSMYPTMKQGERLILNRIAKTFKQELKRGDIITFEAPKSIKTTDGKAVYDTKLDNVFDKFIYYVVEIGKTSYIKRVIALPGEHVEIKDGKVFVNGKKLDEEYLQPDVITETENTVMQDFVVPEGYVFAMGDNRPNSADCREFGCIPFEKVESKVWIRFWPFDVFGKVE